MVDDMLSFAGPVKEVEDGQPIPAWDRERRFFEGAWLHKYDGIYYKD